MREVIGCALIATMFVWPVPVHAELTAADARVRTPAVQGLFYPAEKRQLSAQVDAFLAAKPANTAPGRIRALIAPHAGYRYSGIVAGQGFSQIPADTTRVVIMAPAHRARMKGGGSILDVDAYRNAIGDVPLDPVAAQLRAESNFFGSFPPAHAREHSLEVMLPFLQRKLGHFTLVPIVLGYGFDATAIAKALQPLAQDDKTLFVASTDLSHHHPYDKATALDQSCIKTIMDMDTAALKDRELCGEGPVHVLLELAKLERWQPTLIDYKNSGDTAGAKDSVVGYVTIAFTPRSATLPDRPDGAADAIHRQEGARMPGTDMDYTGKLLSDAEQKLLLDIARQSIWAALTKADMPAMPMYSDTLTRKMGCFVTLNKDGRLRGCIGNIFPAHPLCVAVQQNALSSAFKDQRFEKVTREEMTSIDIEISVLTVPTEVTFADADDLLRQLKPGVHGVVISQGVHQRTTYLPSVWEQISDKVQFLSHLCRKGGMSPNAWRDPNTVKVEFYETFSFGEK